MNQSVNNYNIPALKQKPLTFQQQTPSMQGMTQEDLKQSVDNSYIANRAKASSDANQGAVLASTLGTWALINAGMDRVCHKMGGEYNNSLLGKIGAFGDKIANKSVGKRIENFARWADIKLYKLSKKSKIVYSLRNHSTRPEWNMVKTMGSGLMGFLTTEAESNVLEEFLNPISARPSKTLGIPRGARNHFIKLENYGLSSNDINAFMDSVKGKTFEEQAIALQKKELELLGADTRVISSTARGGLTKLQDLAKDLKAQKLGLKDFKEFESLKGKLLESPDKALKMLDKIATEHPNWKVSILRQNNGKLSGINNALRGRTVSFSELRNKYIATLGKGNKTRLGKFLPKAFAWLTEGTTMRFAGGKIGALFQAYIFGDMLVHIFKAPAGEKIKTAAERLVNDFSYFIAMPIGVLAMHKIGGFKYAGLDKKGVEKYRKAVEIFNRNRDNGVYQNKAAYKLAKSKIKGLLNTKGIKNPITKLLQKCGTLINIGNERIKPFKSVKTMNMNWFRTLKNSNIIGAPLRFIIPMMLISPLIAKTATKLAHAIFGRPTNSVLDEDKEEETKVDDQNKNQEVPFNGQEQPQKVATEPVDPNTFGESNLIKQAVNGTTSTPAQVQDTEQKEPQSMSDEPVRTYIPSPEGVVIQDPNAQKAQDVLDRADKAEKMIQDTLKGLAK
jgi:hypothetical protein